MDNYPEMYDAALGIVLAMPPADMARFADDVERELGPAAPIPEFLNFQAEMADWLRLQTTERIKLVLAAAWRALPESERPAAAKYFTENARGLGG